MSCKRCLVMAIYIFGLACVVSSCKRSTPSISVDPVSKGMNQNKQKKRHIILPQCQPFLIELSPIIGLRTGSKILETNKINTYGLNVSYLSGDNPASFAYLKTSEKDVENGKVNLKRAMSKFLMNCDNMFYFKAIKIDGDNEMISWRAFRTAKERISISSQLRSIQMVLDETDSLSLNVSFENSTERELNEAGYLWGIIRQDEILLIGKIRRDKKHESSRYIFTGSFSNFKHLTKAEMFANIDNANDALMESAKSLIHCNILTEESFQIEPPKI